MQNNPGVTSRLKQSLDSYFLDRQALKRLCEILEQRVAAAAIQEVQQMIQGDASDDVFASDKKIVGEMFRLSVTVVGTDNVELFGSVAEVFASPNFPEQITTFYANSSSALKGRYNYHPRNSVEIFLDFSRPPSLDFNFSPSHGTSNSSNFVVQGFDATWTHGLFHELVMFFNDRKVSFRWIHKHSVWDAILWLAVFPMSLWVCYRLALVIEPALSMYSGFLRAAIYIYIVVVCINFLRALFHYARWLWPRAEYVGTRSAAIRHKAILGTIAIGLVGSFIWDVLLYNW